MPPIHTRSTESSALPVVIFRLSLIDRSGPNPLLNPLPNRAENFLKNAAQICIKCLLCTNHPVRQQECKEEKVCSFKELALMEDRDNYKEVRIMT